MKVRYAVSSELLSAVQLDGHTLNVRLDNGRFTRLEPIAGPAKAVMLSLPHDPHVHLDKTYTAHRCQADKPGLFGAIEAAERDKAVWTEADIRSRANRGLQEAFENGVAALRTHVDWGTPKTPLAWDVLGEAVETWRGRMVLQRASLSTLDLLGDVDHGTKIAKTVAQSGSVLGCFIYRNTDLDVKLERVFALAIRFDLHLDFHVDEGLEPEARGFDTIVALTAKHRMRGRVLCGHACSLAIRPEAEVSRVISAAAEAGVALTVMPSTNLYLQDMSSGRTPRQRGLAPMHELRAAGVEVLLGTDNVRDAFYPFGTYDPLEVLRLGCLAAHLNPSDWRQAIASGPARAMGLAVPKIAVGEPADFILIEAADWAEAISNPRAPRHIFRAGRALTLEKAAA